MDYESREGSCYKYFSEDLTYDDAQAVCEADGATLVEIGSEEEQEVVKG